MDYLSLQFPHILSKIGCIMWEGMTFLIGATMTWVSAMLLYGRLFSYKEIGVIETSGNKLYWVIYPSKKDTDLTECNFGWKIAAAGNAEVRLYKGSNPAGVGSALTLNNKNQYSDYVAKTVIKKATEAPTAIGTEIDIDFITSDKRSKADLQTMQWILKSMSTAEQIYILEVKALENNLKYGVDLALYEPK